MQHEPDALFSDSDTYGVISHESHMLGTFLKRRRVLVSFIPFPRFRRCKVPCVIKVSGSS